MEQDYFIKVSEQIQTVLGEEKLDELGYKTRFCEKKRLVTPFRLVLALIAGLGGGPVRYISELHRRFNALFSTSLEYKPFHNRLAKKAFPVFMEAVTRESWQQWSEQVLTARSTALFDEFDQVIIQDGSSFAVKETLLQIFPGRFKTVSPAAVELHVAIDLLTGVPLQMALTADTASERAHQPEPESLQGGLYLADRGYFDIHRLERIDAAGGAFIVRSPGSINPYIVSAKLEDGTPLPQLQGKKLKQVRNSLKRKQGVDLMVAWGSRKAPIIHRLIMTWNPVIKQFQYLVTNLPESRYDANTIREAYRLRWQIELLFKEWKSHHNLHAFQTGKESIVKGLIWASLTAAALTRYMAHATQLATGKAISTHRTAMSAVHFVPEIVKALQLKSPERVTQVVASTIRFLAINAKRANPNRDNSKGRTSSGFCLVGVDP